MKKLKIIFLAYVLASVTSCIYGGEGSYSEEKLPAYANKSGENVKIVAIAEGHPPYEKLIANGDTLYNYPTEEWNVFFLIGCESAYCDILSRVELHFLNYPQKCLIFDGPIRHNSIDIRSLESYKKGEKKLDNITTYSIAYVYTITPEHKAMAKEEDCPSSAGE
ncbi:MAG: hypothetical protein LBC87_05670 [Fibromonadaceae bacterium]|jgi:hypothetical protein|nr:hypothetical protein [Fibromonadaceae bacterium]